MLTTRRALLFGSALSTAAFAQQKTPERYPEAPFVPTPVEVIDAMLKLAEVRASDVVYDLGCGDGRIVVAAAQKFGASGFGVDIDGELIRDARERAGKAGVSGKTRFVEADLFETDVRPASVVALYILPKMMERLKPKLLADLKPGSRIVSFSFPFPDWTPAKTLDVNSRHIYLWIVPERAK